MRISDWSSDVCSSDLTCAASSAAGSSMPSRPTPHFISIRPWRDSDLASPPTRCSSSCANGHPPRQLTPGRGQARGRDALRGERLRGCFRERAHHLHLGERHALKIDETVEHPLGDILYPVPGESARGWGGRNGK